jgi:hypothetical protein
MSKRIFYILFFLAITATATFAQGFDWQYSARMPFNTPKMFVGISAEADYAMSTGYINYIQKYFSCCYFEQGSGIGIKTGIYGEWWTNSDLAVTAGIKYASVNNIFKKQSESYPVVDSSYLQTEYQFESNAHYLNTDIGAKYRLFGTHLHLDLNAAFAFLISNNMIHIERAISQRSFSDGSREKIIPEDVGSTAKLNTIVIYPEVKIGYDFSIGLGKYATIFAGVEVPIMNTAKSTDWKLTQVFLGFSILSGIK